MGNQEGQEGNQKLLYDDAGNFSSMRFMSITAFGAVIVLVIVLTVIEAICPQIDMESTVELIKWLLGAAFGPKAVQKFAEARAKLKS